MTAWFANIGVVLFALAGAVTVLAYKMHRHPTDGSILRRALVAISPTLNRQQRVVSKGEVFARLAGVIAVPALIAYGTLSPWSEAVAKLEPIGEGPYIPYAAWWSSSTVGDKTTVERGALYVVSSRMFKSSSTFEVREVNSVVTVEEDRFGMFYLSFFVLLFIGGVAWEVRRLSVGKNGA